MVVQSHHARAREHVPAQSDSITIFYLTPLLLESFVIHRAERRGAHDQLGNGTRQVIGGIQADGGEKICGRKRRLRELRSVENEVREEEDVDGYTRGVASSKGRSSENRQVREWGF